MNTYNTEVSFFIEFKRGTDRQAAKSELEKLADDLTVGGPGCGTLAGLITTAHTSKASYERVFDVTLYSLGDGSWNAIPAETIPDPVKDYVARVELSRKLKLH